MKPVHISNTLLQEARLCAVLRVAQRTGKPEPRAARSVDNRATRGRWWQMFVATEQEAEFVVGCG